jgi:hypothetical protein
MVTVNREAKAAKITVRSKTTRAILQGWLACQLARFLRIFSLIYLLLFPY